MRHKHGTRYNPNPRVGRRITVDLTGPEWNWIAEQAAALNVPLSSHVRNVLTIAAPQAQDAEHFDAMKRALFEARQATFGFLTRVVIALYDEFRNDPASFVPANHRANPAMLASAPAWEEPGAPNITKPGGNFP